MNRRSATVVATVAVAALAAGSAAALGVSSQATATDVDADTAAVALAGTQVELFGTTLLLPDDYAAFSMQDGQMVSVGDAAGLSEETLASIEAQLTAAPAQSVVFVDLESTREDGLTTALATVTPTNGLTRGTTNEQLQQWLTSLFADQEGTVASQPIPDVPNASFTYTETIDELDWQVTEYVVQFSDAAVSVRLSAVDDSGQTQAEFDQIVASMSRAA